MAETEEYERKVQAMAANQRAQGALNDDDGLFDKKDRFKMVKKEGERMARLRQEELLEKIALTEEKTRVKLV